MTRTRRGLGGGKGIVEQELSLIVNGRSRFNRFHQIFLN